MDILRDPQGLYFNDSISNMPPVMTADDMIGYITESGDYLIQITKNDVWIYRNVDGHCNGFLYADTLAEAFDKFLKGAFSG